MITHPGSPLWADQHFPSCDNQWKILIQFSICQERETISITRRLGRANSNHLPCQTCEE